MMTTAKGLVAAAVALAALMTVGCVEAPFERVNANDSTVEFSMSLVASRDTATTENSIIYFLVETNPQQTGYAPVWEVSPSGIATHLGGGVFYFAGGAQVNVTVTASYYGKSASYVVVRKP
jgi:hypothetical protein